MQFLPIQYSSSFEKSEFPELRSTEIMDCLQEYLKNRGFNYIKREGNKINFHQNSLWRDKNSFLMSGTILLVENEKTIKVINGNWMVVLISIPFIFLFVASKTQYSTFDESDMEILWIFFLVLFIGNVISRVVAHLILRNRIRALVNKTMPNNGS